MPEIQGLIFDLDGVIAETAEYHYQAWQQLADEKGVAFDREKNKRLLGVTNDVSLRIFTEGVDIDDDTLQAWSKRKDSYFTERMNQLTPGDELPGVVQLLDDADAAGIPVGVGSSSRNARPVLRRLGLIDRFVAVGDGYTVENSKPAPDIFLWVAGGLGVLPRHALVIEDSAAGVQAALHGGFYVIGVGNAVGDNAHANLRDLAGLSLADLVALLPDA